MKLTWSHRLVFGLILFVTYSLVTYLMNFLLVNQQSTSQILFSSLFFSIAMTIFFPLIMKWTANKLAKKIDAFLPNVISEDEEIDFHEMANLTKGIEKVGGKLFLTNKRLLFISHKLNIQSGVISINPVNISSVEEVKIIKMFDTGLRINLKDGTSYLFVVNERETWVEKLNPNTIVA